MDLVRPSPHRTGDGASPASRPSDRACHLFADVGHPLRRCAMVDMSDTGRPRNGRPDPDAPTHIEPCYCPPADALRAVDARERRAAPRQPAELRERISRFARPSDRRRESVAAGRRAVHGRERRHVRAACDRTSIDRRPDAAPAHGRRGLSRRSGIHERDHRVGCADVRERDGSVAQLAAALRAAQRRALRRGGHGRRLLGRLSLCVGRHVRLHR